MAITPAALRPLTAEQTAYRAGILMPSSSGGMELLASHRNYTQQFSTSAFSRRDAQPFPEVTFSMTYGPATAPVTGDALEPERTIRGRLTPDPPGRWNTVQGPQFTVTTDGREETRRHEVAYRIDHDRASGRFTMTIRGSGSAPDRVLDIANPRDQQLAMVILVADAAAQQLSGDAGYYRNSTNRDILQGAFERLAGLPPGARWAP
ncbi:MAG: hypothetical protein V1861_06305 [Candidatus Micrarchaeota archaeon]